MFEVVVTVIRPEAAVVKTEDVINPVGLSWNSRGFLIGRRPPVMSPVWSAPPNRVCSQDLSTGAVITTLLSRGVLRTRNRQNTQEDVL